MANRACENCDYSYGVKMKYKLECRRYPLTPILDQAKREIINTNAVVPHNYWCGEFKQKENADD